MKKYILIVLALVLSIALFGCEETSNATTARRAEQAAVGNQDATYVENQPVPFFNYSLPRDLWIQFYKASTANVVNTWSCEVSDYGAPISEIYESVGYPIPMDTQLTNPQKIADSYQSGYAIIPQSEPNGLYTSPNTNATIIMVADGKGNVAPIYSEHKVQCWSFPVKWDENKKIFVRDGKASVTLKTK